MRRETHRGARTDPHAKTDTLAFSAALANDPYDPAVFDYNSITKNPAFSAQAAGAVSGMLPVSDGDVLQWECHIINDSMMPLGYTNEVKTGEMCNTWGFTVGTEPVQCGVP